MVVVLLLLFWLGVVLGEHRYNRKSAINLTALSQFDLMASSPFVPCARIKISALASFSMVAGEEKSL